ncbi:hypothetical protein [Streptomyces sp. cmx-4-25]
MTPASGTFSPGPVPMISWAWSGDLPKVEKICEILPYGEVAPVVV